MKKLRSDALWHTFAKEQQKKIQQWLFEEHLSYRQTLERMKTELGLVCAMSTLSALYQYLEELRNSDPCRNLIDLAGQAAASGVPLENMRSASQLLIASQLMKKCVGRGSVREIATLGRLMLQGEDQDIKRARAELWVNRRNPDGSQTQTASSAHNFTFQPPENP